MCAVTPMRVGIGYDIHALTDDRKLILGGVHIPHDLGCKGHSDGDPLLHAIIDAMLGASGQGDIGEHFPDNNPEFRDMPSSDLLTRTCEIVCGKWRVVNVDATVITQAPKLKPYKHRMEARIAELIQIGADCVNVKAKTNEGFGAIGQNRAIAAHAAVLIEPR